jgi:CRISPR-associated protein Csx17
LIDDLGAVALRRLIEARKQGAHAFPLQGRAFASLDAVTAFLDGRVDESRIAGLCRALMTIRPFPLVAPPRSSFEAASALHAIFRLAHLPQTLGALAVRCDPEPSRLLLAGRLEDATRAALGRLSSSGLRPKLRTGAGGPDFAKRLAASLVIPVSVPDLEQLVRFLSKPTELIAGIHPVLRDHSPNARSTHVD